MFSINPKFSRLVSLSVHQWQWIPRVPKQNDKQIFIMNHGIRDYSLSKHRHTCFSQSYGKSFKYVHFFAEIIRRKQQKICYLTVKKIIGCFIKRTKTLSYNLKTITHKKCWYTSMNSTVKYLWKTVFISKISWEVKEIHSFYENEIISKLSCNLQSSTYEKTENTCEAAMKNYHIIF